MQIGTMIDADWQIVITLGQRELPMPKNIVVCCDGTGNEIETCTTNVLKLFRCLEKYAGQVVFYDPGVGTIASVKPWSQWRQDLSTVFELATGKGIDDRVLKAYQFVTQTYEEGDQIFLFGFSRGAYTVRIVAALVHAIGLLAPHQANLAEYGLKYYRQLAGRDEESPDFTRLGRFKKFAGGRNVTIRFVGVWDSVSSLFEPVGGLSLLPRMRMLPFTRTNEKVQVFRQAMAIDEPRRFFRLNRWRDPQNSFIGFKDGQAVTEPQNIRQLWFAGNHSDIGGGHPEDEAGLAKFPLIWMTEEAEKFGLRVDQDDFRHLAHGLPPPRSPQRHTFAKPDSNAMLHSKVAWFYRLVEWLPKSARWKVWPNRRVVLGFYIPRYEPRAIPEGALIHVSVQQRKGNPANGYNPVNLPGAPVFVPK